MLKLPSPRLLLLFSLFQVSLFGQTEELSTRILAGPLLDQAEVKPGDQIPTDLVVYSETGEKKFLLDVVNGKYTVLVSGCLTCPIFHRTYPEVEALYQDYKDTAGLQFFYLYKSLAHPEYNGYVQPVTLQERLAQIIEAKRVLGTSLTWICDGMDNAVRHTLGFGPNTQMIIDPKGTIVHALGWSKGEVLHAELEKYVGKSKTHTEVADLTIPRQAPAIDSRAGNRQANQGPRFSETLVPLLINAKSTGKQPLYVKPRVEVTPGVLQRGRGEMYLGFRLDPIHHVHWNNLAAPLQYELNLPDGVYLTPKRAVANKVEADADEAPREFVIEVTSCEPGSVFDLTFHYFACSDEEGWCVPVTQTYEVTLAVDPDGGGTMGRSFNGGGGRQNTAQQNRGAQRGGPGGRQAPGPDNLKERIMQSDSDGDGKISMNEAPAQMQSRFAQADQDGDGLLDDTEINAFVANSRPSQSGQQRGQGPGSTLSGPGQRRGPGPPDGNQVAQMMNFDSNGDGKLTPEELPGLMQQRFGRMDENGDGVIDQEEVDAMATRFQGGPGPQGRRAQPPGRPSRDNI
jgi:Ca2+-binding EF-hand superfamily protein